MKKVLLLFILIFLAFIPVNAAEFTAPPAPDSALEYLPEDTESFADGLWYVFRTALGKIQPSITKACGVCLSIIAVNLLTSVASYFTGTAKRTISLVGTVVSGVILFQATGTLVHLGVETVNELNEYGKLLLPVMSAAVAAQGGVTTSSMIYAGTAAFMAILTTAITKLLVPMVYIYLCLSIAVGALGDQTLKSLQGSVKWLMTWTLKIILYIFTGYMAITGVISGTTDAATLRAAKLTISGAVPVVGGILSDASEAVLVSAGLMKNSVGIYGLLAIMALWIGPFLQIGVQYLLLKLTAGVCSSFGSKETSGVVGAFSSSMGFILAMTGAICIMILVSTVCFMRGVG